MFAVILNLIGKVSPDAGRDSGSRINTYTALLLLIFAIMVGSKQYAGSPISCWVPPQFKGSWQVYVNNYCFMENTYWTPIYDSLPLYSAGREEREVLYYQWVPFVLALQALFFYLPLLIWNLIRTGSGQNVNALIQAAYGSRPRDGKRVLMKTDERIKNVVNQMKEAIDFKRDHFGKSTGFRLVKGHGVYLTLAYLFIKALCIVNSIGQLLILNRFVGSAYRWWGIGILQDLAQGKEWETTGHFPRVTMCDFKVRRLGNIHPYSVQCVLPINMFNEKLFLFLWLWFCFVAILNCANLLHWLCVTLVPGLRVAFIRRHLTNQLDHGRPHANRIRHFSSLLGPDNILLLRLMCGNNADVVSVKLVNGLWEKIYDVSVESVRNANRDYGGRVHLSETQIETLKDGYKEDLSETQSEVLDDGYKEELLF